MRPATRGDVRYDLADRMAKALLHSGLSVQQMADLLECSRGSVSGWLNRRHPPSPQTLQLWAHYTNVPYEWLRDGERYKWPKPVKPQVEEG